MTLIIVARMESKESIRDMQSAKIRIKLKNIPHPLLTPTPWNCSFFGGWEGKGAKQRLGGCPKMQRESGVLAEF